MNAREKNRTREPKLRERRPLTNIALVDDTGADDGGAAVESSEDLVHTRACGVAGLVQVVPQHE